MKSLIITLFVASLGLGCQSCGPMQPNIREEPGASDCPAFCAKMVELGKTDPVCLDYLLDPPDGGTDLCVAWCVNSQVNSVQLNPGCMKNVSNCSQVECASHITPTECVNLDTVCK